ncbi:MAG: TRAP transporter large permease subunit, partial [Burkholderiales bacterium]
MEHGLLLGLLGLVALVGLIAIRIPIAYSMILVGAAGMMVLGDPLIFLAQLKNLAYSQFSIYDLSVLPMFVLMGNISTRAGLSRDLFRAANAWLGWMRGGVAMAAIAACAGFGAVCGSSLATASTMG